MALRGTLTHWKTRLLAQALHIPPCYALGLLEALWHVTSETAPAGNIGRLPNKAIAMEMFYEGDPDELISALIHSGHLDENEEHRLIIHDWSQHADYNTRRKVTRHGQSMLANDGSRRVMTPHESIPEPVPEPEPEPEPKIKTLPASRQAPSKHEKPVIPDKRHIACRTLVHAYWHERHREEEFAPWDASEAKALSRLLKAKPDLTAEKFTTLLEFRARSDVNHDERPRAWLERLTDFASGPLDRFKLPEPPPRFHPGFTPA